MAPVTLGGSALPTAPTNARARAGRSSVEVARSFDCSGPSWWFASRRPPARSTTTRLPGIGRQGAAAARRRGAGARRPGSLGAPRTGLRGKNVRKSSTTRMFGGALMRRSYPPRAGERGCDPTPTTLCRALCRTPRPSSELADHGQVSLISGRLAVPDRVVGLCPRRGSTGSLGTWTARPQHARSRPRFDDHPA